MEARPHRKRHDAASVVLPALLRLEGVSFQVSSEVRTCCFSLFRAKLAQAWACTASSAPTAAVKPLCSKSCVVCIPPHEGRVLIDGADIHQFTQAELAQRIGYLSQTNQLLSATIRDNIALANPDASDEQIIQAAQRACAHDFVIDLPNGYGTQVGEGATLFCRSNQTHRHRTGLAQRPAGAVARRAHGRARPRLRNAHLSAPSKNWPKNAPSSSSPTARSCSAIATAFW